MSFNHPQTTLSFTGPRKNYLPKPILDAKKAGTTALGTQVNSAEGFFPLGSRVHLKTNMQGCLFSGPPSHSV